MEKMTVLRITFYGASLCAGSGSVCLSDRKAYGRWIKKTRESKNETWMFITFEGPDGSGKINAD